MPTDHGKRDIIASSISTTLQKPNIEQWLETMEGYIHQAMERNHVAPELTISQRRPGSFEQHANLDGEILEAAHQQENKNQDPSYRTSRFEVRLREAEREMEMVEESMGSWKQQLSAKGYVDKFGGQIGRVILHGELLKIANEQVNLQQDLINKLLDTQAFIARQVTFITQQLAQKQEQGAQQSSLAVRDSVTETSDYVLVSGDEASD
ncbi:hypothetical protein N7475_009949 [Penicillium sp. IBT 31633x]|nr:hypothetical protein N7475_009949 [Penicillium sp. IBT 31633x]